MILLPSEEVKKKKVDEPVKTPAPPIRKDSPISAVIEQPETKEASEETEDEQVALPKPKAIDVLAEIEEDVELDEFTEDTYHEIVEGEDDVVYGTEEITNAAIMDFVHKYPDSALKFLYRKRLDGKAVSSEEEEIYRNWEKRKMFRAKVKAYILSLMEWDKMPQEPLFEIWKRMRDHIYEVID
ncbi:MAG: hypothetical protein OEY59_05785 [Deltaproteobacteria bacterium]|nr:hypothetical protein [Deltaproteobacteria bacterium]